ncbi:MAG: FAD:protein FMN transferase [Bacteroidales bacterium]
MASFIYRFRKVLILLSVIAITILSMYVYNNNQDDNSPCQRNEGKIFGTLYHIVYEHPIDLKDSIEFELNRFDNSLSMFNPNSVISRVNNNDSSVILDRWFVTLFKKSKEISRITEGAFDITVAPLVNLWGFGFKSRSDVTTDRVDSVLTFVGSNLIDISNGLVSKSDKRVMLDASAIAKGYACDVIADYLREKGIDNFMVEIGGELVVSGVNSKGSSWRVGISKPQDDSLSVGGDLEEVLELTNVAMATSGNYRNFYIKDGKKFAHTIDPRNGYPIQHELLSATVIASDCMIADAYATAFMVMGLDKSLDIVERDPMLEAFFIYNDEGGHYKTIASRGLRRYIKD